MYAIAHISLASRPHPSKCELLNVQQALSGGEGERMLADDDRLILVVRDDLTSLSSGEGAGVWVEAGTRWVR